MILPVNFNIKNHQILKYSHSAQKNPTEIMEERLKKNKPKPNKKQLPATILGMKQEHTKQF